MCGFAGVSDGCVSLPAHPHSHTAGTSPPVTEPGPSTHGILAFKDGSVKKLKKKINPHFGNTQIHEMKSPVGRQGLCQPHSEPKETQLEPPQVVPYWTLVLKLVLPSGQSLLSAMWPEPQNRP